MCEHHARLLRGQLTCSKCRAVYKIMPGRNEWVPPLTPSERGKLAAGVAKPRRKAAP